MKAAEERKGEEVAQLGLQHREAFFHLQLYLAVVRALARAT